MTDQTQPPSALAMIRELDLQIRRWPIAELRALGRKARHHNDRQLAGIKASIAQFGLLSPVLIEGSGKVLAGLARLEAAKALGMTTVPAVVIDHLSPEEQRAFVLADNRLPGLGSWNKEVLQLELEELSLLDLDFSLDLAGFSMPEIEAIRFGVGRSDPG